MAAIPVEIYRHRVIQLCVYYPTISRTSFDHDYYVHVPTVFEARWINSAVVDRGPPSGA